MAGSTRRVAWAVVALAAALTSLAACGGGDGDVESFNVDFSSVEDAQAVYSQSLLKAVDRCMAQDPPLRVQWKFAKRDVENPIAQEYIRAGYPSFIDCSTIQGGGTGGTQLPGVVSQPNVGAGQAQEDGGE